MKHWLKMTAAVALMVSLAAATADDELGSTMTLKQIQKVSQTGRDETKIPVWDVTSAAEVTPALKYSLYPKKWQLKPGSALLHFNRAMITWLQLPKEKRHEWTSQEWLTGDGDGHKPSIQELGQAVESMDWIYQELNDLAKSEDFVWDHRLKDVTGPDVYSYTLQDVQELRSLAQLLQLKINWQIATQDFDGAVSSIRDGIRLSEFVGQGETLIQKLVGIAIQAMMREKIKELIAVPGSPNLYWAIATIPRPLNSIGDSVIWELSNVSRICPLLANPAESLWSEQDAKKKWENAIDDLMELGDMSGAGSSVARIAISVIGVTQITAARDQLIANGMDPSRVDQMPDFQKLIVATSQELNRMGDNLSKAYLLPPVPRQKLAEKLNLEFQKYIRENRTNSLAAMYAWRLYPALSQAAEAEVRAEMTYHRLMTLEAIRMYVAENNKLPESLDQLEDAPAFQDPYSGQPFGYSVEETDQGPVVVLKSTGPESYVALQQLKFRFKELK